MQLVMVMLVGPGRLGEVVRAAGSGNISSTCLTLRVLFATSLNDSPL